MSSRLTRLLGATLFIVSTVWAGPAAAGKIATLVRGVGAGSDKAAGYVAHFVRDIYAKDERYDKVDLMATLGSPDYDRAEQAFATADEMIAKGREAYESLDLDPAVEHLNTALSKYERHAAFVTDFKKVAEGLMLLGATHILRGEEKTGAKRLAQAIALYPEIEPDPHIFNPGMRQVFDKAGKDLARRPTGDISLTSNPSYGEVYIDGNFVGVTPVTIPDVTEGRHYVRVVKDGYRSWGKLLDVRGGAETAETANVKPTQNFEDFDGLLEDAVKAIPIDMDDPNGPMVDAVDQLGVLLTIDQLFLCEVSLDGEKVQMRAILYDLNLQTRVKLASRSFTYTSDPSVYQKEVGAFYEENFSPDALGPRPGDPNYDPDSGKGLVHAGSAVCGGMACSTFKYVIAGSVLGGGGLFVLFGSVLWGLAQGQNDRFRTQVAQATDDFDKVRGDGVAFAAAGDVLFFTGAAAVVIGAILMLTWDPAPSASQVVSGSDNFGLSFAPIKDGAAFTARIRF